MDRRAIAPRPNWRKRVESHGLLYHTLGGVTYWDESASYLFRPAEIDTVETLHSMCLQIHAREGANLRVVRGGRVVIETDGPYAEGPFVYQRFCPPRAFDGRYPILGAWIVNHQACGLGIREDESVITGNTSRFIPHRMVF